jgi:Domain of unknown function (DUF397)
MQLFSIGRAKRSRRTAGKLVQDWAKSTLSQYNGNCVEVAGLATDAILVRDSKNPRAGHLRFTPAEWDAFVGGVRLGEFDRRQDA